MLLCAYRFFSVGDRAVIKTREFKPDFGIPFCVFPPVDLGLVMEKADTRF
jgi:hypothetical protein